MTFTDFMFGVNGRRLLEIMNCDELAETLSVTTETLSVWRAEGKGPAYVKAGRSVFYRIEDIASWLTNNQVYPSRSTGDFSSEPPAQPPKMPLPPLPPLPPMQEQNFPEPVGVLQ